MLFRSKNQGLFVFLATALFISFKRDFISAAESLLTCFLNCLRVGCLADAGGNFGSLACAGFGFTGDFTVVVFGIFGLPALPVPYPDVGKSGTFFIGDIVVPPIFFF